MAKPSPRYSKHPVLVALGEQILRRRLHLDLSQENLAESAGMDRSYIGGIERGEHNITLINLKRIADALKVPLSHLLVEAGVDVPSIFSGKAESAEQTETNSQQTSDV